MLDSILKKARFNMDKDNLLNIVFVCGLTLIILGLIAAFMEMYETSALASSFGVITLFYCFYSNEGN